MELSNILGSIYSFIYNLNKEAHIYYDDVPESLAVPSMYFPLPEVTPTASTLFSYTKDNLIYINIFERTTRVAMDKAIKIVSQISDRGFKIPLINSSGEYQGVEIRIGEVNAKSIDMGISQVYLMWKVENYYSNVVINPEYMENFIVEGGIKS